MTPTTDSPLRPGHVLVGSLFSEPMRVETVADGGVGTWIVGLVGTHSERFRKASLSNADLDGLTIHDMNFRYDGDGALLPRATSRGRAPLAS